MLPIFQEHTYEGIQLVGASIKDAQLIENL